MRIIAIMVIMRDELIQEIRFVRKSKRWSQERLAEKSGVSRVTISAFERGMPIRLDTLRRITDALGIALKIEPPKEIN